MGVDGGADPVNLLTLSEQSAHGGVELVGLLGFGEEMGGDGLAAGGELVQDGTVEVAEHRELKRARDGGGGHGE